MTAIAAARLTERPVAHRGLHDADAGIVENTRTAFVAAIDAGYAIETDLQISADGEAMVHHDDALGRLIDGERRLNELTSRQLAALPYKASTDRMMTLAELCALVAGRTALLIELKSHLDGDKRLVRRVADTLEGYAGPVGVMSFDPHLVRQMRAEAPHLIRGVVAERHATEGEPHATLLQALGVRPHFVAYSVMDLPAVMPTLARNLLRLPLFAWTVRSVADRRHALRHADQIIFEGFRP